MILFFTALTLSSLLIFFILCIFAIYQFSIKGDVNFYVMFFALIFLFVSFYGAVGFAYTKLKEAGIFIEII